MVSLCTFVRQLPSLFRSRPPHHENAQPQNSMLVVKFFRRYRSCRKRSCSFDFTPHSCFSNVPTSQHLRNSIAHVYAALLKSSPPPPTAPQTAPSCTNQHTSSLLPILPFPDSPIRPLLVQHTIPTLFASYRVATSNRNFCAAVTADV